MKKISAWNHPGELHEVKIVCHRDDYVAMVGELIKAGFSEILVEDY